MVVLVLCFESRSPKVYLEPRDVFEDAQKLIDKENRTRTRKQLPTVIGRTARAFNSFELDDIIELENKLLRLGKGDSELFSIREKGTRKKVGSILAITPLIYSEV